jgi:hypothetical protein
VCKIQVINSTDGLHQRYTAEHGRNEVQPLRIFDMLMNSNPLL